VEIHLRDEDAIKKDTNFRVGVIKGSEAKSAFHNRVEKPDVESRSLVERGELRVIVYRLAKRVLSVECREGV
jgi:hypothetical protein